MNSKKDIFALIFWCILLVTIGYINGLAAIVSTVIAFLLYALLTYIIYIVWKKIRDSEQMSPREYIEWFTYKSAISISIVLSIIVGFIYYNNEISPAKMPTYYLSNGERQVTFQSMIHIAHPDFYTQIEQDILFAKQDGYVYFFEGVKPGSTESHQAFNKALGIKFDAELYKNFSELYGIVAQDNAQFLGLKNDLDFNVDMNMDEIMELYKQKSNINESKISPDILDANTEIIKLLSQLSPKQKKVLVYVNQGILNFFTKNESIRNTILENLGNQDIFSIILDERNRLVANEIINSKHKDIYITYGLLHFEGVLELLQKNDSNWIVNGVEYLIPIQ